MYNISMLVAFLVHHGYSIFAVSDDELHAEHAMEDLRALPFAALDSPVKTKSPLILGKYNADEMTDGVKGSLFKAFKTPGGINTILVCA